MKTRILLFVTFLLFSNNSFSQNKTSEDKKQIQLIINTFMNCLTKKDSTKFYSLFYSDPVVWAGVTKHKTFSQELKKDGNAKDSFRSDYKSFYRYFYDKPIEEKFSNIKILDDGYIATVIFDYSFWEKGTKMNWGKESWAMIKADGKWKITSIIFSTEDEAINPERPIKNK
ncbi:nuclear transport factor 2 family protein [Epilithonimonas sp.]|uniref:nuclear transport factor 2 family protein n=1 Tax=Epilithonimonas sp. TaxID=2894511 RepID=UPI0035B3FFF4